MRAVNKYINHAKIEFSRQYTCGILVYNQFTHPFSVQTDPLTPLFLLNIWSTVSVTLEFDACCHVLMVSKGCPISTPHAPKTTLISVIKQFVLISGRCEYK